MHSDVKNCASFERSNFVLPFRGSCQKVLEADETQLDATKQVKKLFVKKSNVSDNNNLLPRTRMPKHFERNHLQEKSISDKLFSANFLIKQ